jgi:hypothetical protein
MVDPTQELIAQLIEFEFLISIEFFLMTKITENDSISPLP